MRTIITLVCLGCIFTTACKNTPRDGRPDVATVRRVYGPRPSHWVNGQPIVDPASANDIERLERIGRDTSIRLERNTRSAPVAIRAQALLLPTQEVVGVHDSIPSFWQWEEVAETIRRLGQSITVNEISRVASVINQQAGSYDQINDRFAISIADETELEGRIATIVHEATHRVYLEHALRQSGLSRQAYIRMITVCPDLRFAHAFASEALAHYNEAIWTVNRARERHIDLEEYRPHSYIRHRKISDIANNDESAREWFVSYLRGYVERADQLHGITSEDAGQGPPCGPFVRLRNSDRGSVSLPSDIARDLLVPLFEILPPLR